MEQMSYAGFFNYKNINGLPLTKMVTDIEESKEDVVSLLQEHSDAHEKAMSSYHISVYVSGNKVGQVGLSSFRF